MAFINRATTIVPGFGSPFQNDTLFLLQGTALTAAGTKTTTMAGLTPTISRGYVRLKMSGLAATQVITVVSVSFTDGTTTVFVFHYQPAAGLVLTATTVLDFLFPFLIDINATSMTNVVTQTGAGAPGIIDIEISGTS